MTLVKRKTFVQPEMDKKEHFMIGAGVGILAILSPVVGLLTGLTLAFAKEVYDSTGKGTPDWSDFMYTVAGNSLMVTFIMTLNLFI